MKKFAVDSCVLLDILNDSGCRVSSQSILEKVSRSHHLVVCDIVIAEVAPAFDSKDELEKFLNETGMYLDRFSPETLYLSGVLWGKYLKKGGKRQQRILPDFLVAAHSIQQCSGLITRDKYFKKIPGLKVLYQ